MTDKDKNDLSVTLKNTQYKYTGENINFTTNVEDNFTLKSNISGNTLSSKAITAVEGKDLNPLKNVGDSDILKVTINKIGDEELNRTMPQELLIPQDIIQQIRQLLLLVI